MSEVTTEYSGSGDPKRSIELLWGIQERPKRGPKPRLTVDQIAKVAIEVADGEGLAALSMRRVADELGVTAMSLYTYVPGKAELLDVMVDTVYGELPTHEGDEGPWRTRLEQVARANWALYRRHPWLLHVATSRPVLGPNLMAKYDYELRAVAGLGLTEVEMDLLITVVGNYVHGAVRGAVEAAEAEQRTGLTDDQWWESYAPLLEKVFDANRFPTAARVGSVAGEEYGSASDPVRAFEFGLQRLLDGIAAFVEGGRAAR
jgi:AcrR family transcriptional regulator